MRLALFPFLFLLSLSLYPHFFFCQLECLRGFDLPLSLTHRETLLAISDISAVFSFPFCFSRNRIHPMIITIIIITESEKKCVTERKQTSPKNDNNNNNNKRKKELPPGTLFKCLSARRKCALCECTEVFLFTVGNDPLLSWKRLVLYSNNKNKPSSHRTPIWHPFFLFSLPIFFFNADSPDGGLGRRYRSERRAGSR